MVFSKYKWQSLPKHAAINKPNTRLLLMITAAAGKNVCNFNIFAALLHSVLHFCFCSLTVRFQTKFLPWISSWPCSLPLFCLSFPKSCLDTKLLNKSSTVCCLFCPHSFSLAYLFSFLPFYTHNVPVLCLSTYAACSSGKPFLPTHVL